MSRLEIRTFGVIFSVIACVFTFLAFKHDYLIAGVAFLFSTLCLMIGWNSRTVPKGNHFILSFKRALFEEGASDFYGFSFFAIGILGFAIPYGLNKAWEYFLIVIFT